MTKSTTAAVIIGLIVVAGIAYAFVGGDALMSQKGDSMMDDKASLEGVGAVNGEPDMMMKDDAVMKDATSGSVMKDDAMKDSGTMMKDDGAMMKKGSYEPYSADKLALANSGDVVLFFRAAWCPTCKAVDADIRAHIGAIPAGLTILDVNYDDSTALKKKYGVTYQHTFVQVAADGTQIKKWSASPTLAALVAEVQ